MALTLVSTEQAADYLGVSYHTLIAWRQANKGPKYVTLSPNNPDSTRRTIAYAIEHLDEYIEENIVHTDNSTCTELLEFVDITDNQWNAVYEYFIKPPWSMKLDENQRKYLNNAIQSATYGSFVDRPTVKMLDYYMKTDVKSDNWLIQAFKILGEFDDFPYVLVVQTSIVRLYDADRTAHASWITINTETFGQPPTDRPNEHGFVGPPRRVRLDTDAVEELLKGNTHATGPGGAVDGEEASWPLIHRETPRNLSSKLRRKTGDPLVDALILRLVRPRA
jgi:hypothetical protein